MGSIAGDTEINTVEGKIKIKDLVGRDRIGVYTMSQNHLIVTDAFNINKSYENNQLFRVTFEDDSHIDCTYDHQFYTLIGKSRCVGKAAKDLTPNDSVLKIDMSYVKVKSVQIIGLGDVYGIEVPHINWLFANDVYIHNN